MKAEYDIIVIGAGLSSLMFLSKMVSNKSKLSILVLEQKNSINCNQSFCVWEGPGLINIEKEFKLKAKHRWDKILIENNREKIKKNIHPYHYVCHDGQSDLISFFSILGLLSIRYLEQKFPSELVTWIFLSISLILVTFDAYKIFTFAFNCLESFFRVD